MEHQLHHHFHTGILFWSAVQPGSLVADAEERKLAKYVTLQFQPTAVKTARVVGLSTHYFKVLEHRIVDMPGELCNAGWLFNHILLAVVMGNILRILTSANLIDSEL